jgi:thioredoxin
MKLCKLIFWTLFFASCTAQQNKYLLPPSEFNAKLIAMENVVIVDVRTPEEFQSGTIKGAENIDYNDVHFETHIGQLDQSKTYFVYCLSGGRSAQAGGFMRKKGFKNVYELDGGMMAWRNADLPIQYQSNAKLTDAITRVAYDSIAKSDSIVLIDFYAPWCGPCKKMQPLLDELTIEYAGKALIYRINIDENKKLSRELGIDEIPYFKLYKGGVEKGNFIGQMDRASFIRILNTK